MSHNCSARSCSSRYKPRQLNLPFIAKPEGRSVVAFSLTSSLLEDRFCLVTYFSSSTSSRVLQLADSSCLLAATAAAAAEMAIDFYFCFYYTLVCSFFFLSSLLMFETCTILFVFLRNKIYFLLSNSRFSKQSIICSIIFDKI